jgi:hypothetical protein
MPRKRAVGKSELYALYSGLQHTSWNKALGEADNLRQEQLFVILKENLRNRVVHASADVNSDTWDAVLGQLKIDTKQANAVVAKARPIPPLQVSMGVARAVSSAVPPRFPKFLLLLIPKKNREYVIGDLEEEFHTILVPEYGYRIARCWYWAQVLAAFVPMLWDQLKRASGLAVVLKLLGG